MKREDMVAMFRLMQGWTYAEWQLFCREAEQQFEAKRARVEFTAEDANEAARMVDMAKDWYMPGSEIPAQTSLL